MDILNSSNWVIHNNKYCLCEQLYLLLKTKRGKEQENSVMIVFVINFSNFQTTESMILVYRTSILA